MKNQGEGIICQVEHWHIYFMIQQLHIQMYMLEKLTKVTNRYE